jgi:hypothetical protein
MIYNEVIFNFYYFFQVKVKILKAEFLNFKNYNYQIIILYLEIS